MKNIVKYIAIFSLLLMVGCNKPKNVHVVNATSELLTNIVEETNIDSTPSTLFIYKGKLVEISGALTKENFESIYNSMAEKESKDFTINTFTTIDNKEIDISKYDKVCIQVLQSFCGHCKNEYDNVMKAYIFNEYSDILFIEVFVNSSIEDIKEFIR